MGVGLSLGAVSHMGYRFSEVGGRMGSDSVTGASTSERRIKAYPVGETSTHISAARNALTSPACPIDIYEYDNIPIEDLQHEWEADGWLFIARYNAIVPKKAGWTLSIDTGGGTFTQTQAYATQSFAPTGKTAPNFNNLIDVQQSDTGGVEVNGAERIIPALRFNIRAKIAGEWIASPIAYAKTLAGMTGRVNVASFLDCDAGEMLFAGASGELAGQDPMLTFAFIYSPNLTGLTVGDISGINKKGHETLWFNYRSSKSSSGNLSVKIPRAAYSSQIYEPGDFDVMKIGTPAPVV